MLGPVPGAAATGGLPPRTYSAPVTALTRDANFSVAPEAAALSMDGLTTATMTDGMRPMSASRRSSVVRVRWNGMAGDFSSMPSSTACSPRTHAGTASALPPAPADDTSGMVMNVSRARGEAEAALRDRGLPLARSYLRTDTPSTVSVNTEKPVWGAPGVPYPLRRKLRMSSPTSLADLTSTSSKCGTVTPTCGSSWSFSSSAEAEPAAVPDAVPRRSTTPLLPSSYHDTRTTLTLSTLSDSVVRSCSPWNSCSAAKPMRPGTSCAGRPSTSMLLP